MSWRKPSLDEIKEDLKAISDFEAVIFGSYVTGEYWKGSDIDVAVITRTKDVRKNVGGCKSQNKLPRNSGGKA